MQCNRLINQGEFRREERARAVLMTARLIGAAADDFCLIRDISHFGARLATQQKFNPNDTVTIDFGDNLIIAANVRWIANNAMGVEFKVPMNLERLMSKDFKRDSRRSYPRFERSAVATVSWRVGEATGQLINISPNGARIAFSALPTWQSVEMISVKIAGLSNINCEIKWNKLNDIGIKFKETILFYPFCSWIRENIN